MGVMQRATATPLNMLAASTDSQELAGKIYQETDFGSIANVETTLSSAVFCLK